MKDREELLISVIHFLAEKLKTNIVLEGGMLLRLLNSPRSTQDVDYILISGESKKILAERIRRFFLELKGVIVKSANLNSRGIFFELASTENPSICANVEISVKSALNLPSEDISTVSVARKHSVAGRIVSTVALAEAFSNKIAAALERDSVRDIYDISQFEPLCGYDVPTLGKRLSSLSVNRAKPRMISFKGAAAILREKSARLTEEVLEREIYPLLPVEQRSGLLLIIKAALARVVVRLRDVQLTG